MLLASGSAQTGEHARAALDALPAREALLRRIAELHGDVPRISHLAMAGGRCFALRQDPGASLPVLVVRERPEGPERVLLDTGAGGGEVQRSIDWFVPSPDGRRVALGIAAGGSEESALHVLEVDSGALLDDRIDRVHHGFVSWLDGDALTYHRYREVPPGTPPGEARDDTCSFLHRLGDDPAEDTPLLRRGLNPAVPMAPRDRPFVVVPPRSDWMLAVVSHTALSHTLDEHLSASTIYAAPRAALVDPAACPWAEVAGPDRGVIAFALDGDRLYLVVHRDAPRHQVVELTLGDGAPAERVVVPESERVVLAVRALGDRLVVRDLAGTVGRVREVPLPGGAPREVPLPVEGAISEWATSADPGELLLKVDSWTRSPYVLHYAAGAGAVTDTGWAPPSPVDFSEVEARELLAPARDGTPIPVR
jgi:prolyl oligopeptidase